MEMREQFGGDGYNPGERNGDLDLCAIVCQKLLGCRYMLTVKTTEFPECETGKKSQE